MPLPPEIATKAVHGKFLNSHGDPETGTYRLVGYPYVTFPSIDTIITPTVYEAVFSPATGGEFVLPAVMVTNDPDGNPVDWSYTETVHFQDGHTRARLITIDINAPTTIEISDHT
jgi:hypothetical protein